MAELQLQNHHSLFSYRGITPKQLLAEVENTAGFVFSIPSENLSPQKHQYLNLVRGFKNNEPTSVYDYFSLCLSAHHTTVATFVPTDVDQAIRFRLWDPTLPIEIRLSMAELVLQSAEWDWTPVSAREIRSPLSGHLISGHQGEWLSTAVAAYASLRKHEPKKSQEIFEAVFELLRKSREAFVEFIKVKDGIGALKTATLLAHNLGDLDRVVDLWNSNGSLPENDPILVEAYKAGHRRLPSLGSDLAEAGELNKRLTALENHRHLPLRHVRPLRAHRDLLIPIGPFYDDWGKSLVRYFEGNPRPLAEIGVALIQGWERYSEPAPGPIGYSRALVGIQEIYPDGPQAFWKELPARYARIVKSGPLRKLCSISKAQFETTWNHFGLKKGHA